jgi:hypothetical protein
MAYSESLAQRLIAEDMSGAQYVAHASSSRR